MAAKNVLTDVIVAVRPMSWHERASEHKQTLDCEYILKNIKRHVDDLGHCEILKTFERRCEFCGYRWGEKSNTYNGGCCNKDEENNPENTGQTDLAADQSPQVVNESLPLVNSITEDGS